MDTVVIQVESTVGRFQHYFQGKPDLAGRWTERWKKKGLEKIIERALTEKWDNNPHKLYFLDKPFEIREKPLLKAKTFHQIPRNFTLRLDELNQLNELGGHG